MARFERIVALALVLLSSSQQIAIAEEPIATGTGVIVNAAGDVITNAHVVAACGRLSVNTPAAVRVEAKLLANDTRNDLAVLRAAFKPEGVAILRPNKVRAGEPVVVYGFPLAGTLASSGNVTTGIITALAGLGDDSTRMQVSAPVQPGNSGGPVMDASGRVIGVVVAKLNALKAAVVTGDIPQNVNFAIKAGVATGFLSANDIAFETGDAGRDLPVPDIVDHARTFTVRVECFDVPPTVAAALPPKVANSAKTDPSCFRERQDYKISGILRVKVAQDANGRTERPYVLDLDQPTCMIFSDVESGRPLSPTRGVTSVQVAFATGPYTDFAAANLNKRVSLYGSFFPAMTAHHHLPVLISVTEAVAESPSASNPEPSALEAAGVVRTFYEALGRGDGAAANKIIIPEKRASAAFSADSLTRFYGQMVEPVVVKAISAANSSHVQVSYHWASGKKRCDGMSTVTVVQRDGRLLIESIKANC